MQFSDQNKTCPKCKTSMMDCVKFCPSCGRAFNELLTHEEKAKQAMQFVVTVAIGIAMLILIKTVVGL